MTPATPYPINKPETPEVELPDRVFFALSDPVRRALLERLDEAPLLVSELAAPFAISLQAVSRHIQVLARAKLVRQERSGRRLIENVLPEVAMRWPKQARAREIRSAASLLVGSGRVDIGGPHRFGERRGCTPCILYITWSGRLTQVGPSMSRPSEHGTGLASSEVSTGTGNLSSFTPRGDQIGGPNMIMDVVSGASRRGRLKPPEELYGNSFIPGYLLPFCKKLALATPRQSSGRPGLSGVIV